MCGWRRWRPPKAPPRWACDHGKQPTCNMATGGAYTERPQALRPGAQRPWAPCRLWHPGDDVCRENHLFTRWTLFGRQDARRCSIVLAGFRGEHPHFRRGARVHNLEDEFEKAKYSPKKPDVFIMSGLSPPAPATVNLDG
eukprot:1373024-Prymnesium_polylepis.1